MHVEVGSIVEGRVTGITSFGAFIQLKGGRTGLVHISEIAEEYVKDISQHLKENQLVKVKILSVDGTGKISLSIKQASSEAGEARENRPRGKSGRPSDIEWNRPSQENMSFEDRLAKFLRDSDERLHDLKKNFESKRGSGGYRKPVQFY